MVSMRGINVSGRTITTWFNDTRVVIVVYDIDEVTARFSNKGWARSGSFDSFESAWKWILEWLAVLA